MVIEEFSEWQNETKTAIELWTIRLKNEAIKQGSNNEAIDYLNRNCPDLLCPDLLRDYQELIDEQFQSLIRYVFAEAEHMIIQEMEINHEESN